MDRTIVVSGEGVYLRLSRNQIMVERNGDIIASIPSEDLGTLVLDSQTARYTHKTLTALFSQKSAIVFCGDDHMPSGIALPIEGNSLQAERFRSQIASTKPVMKRLWAQLVREKLFRQAEACPCEISARKIRVLCAKVRSGDPSNLEAQAARIYWENFMQGKSIRRNPEGDFPNDLLNYGYMVLRAAMARAIVAAGFHPSYGIHHSNRYNAFALADDLMEPMRPMVDNLVRRLIYLNWIKLDKDAKATLLGVLSHPTETARQGKGPLENSLQAYCASLHRCFLGEERELDIPWVCLETATANSGNGHKSN